MKNYRPLNDNMVVKIRRKDRMITASGILLAGVEDDFLAGEVLAVGSDYYDENEEFHKMVVEPGDYIVFERQFHHVYNIEERHRVDHTIVAEEDGEFDLVITRQRDVYFKITDAKLRDKLVYGQLFSNGPPKPITRKQQIELGL